MSGSLQRLRTHRSGWKTTSNAATSRRIDRQEPTRRRPQTVVRDSSKPLSGGLLIETSVLARLLGFKLLTLEGTVVVTPAQLRELSQRYPVGTDSTAYARTSDASGAARLTQGHTTTDHQSRQRVGTRLAEAVRLLHETAGDLEGLDQDC